jgi:hypothetical protein
MNDEARHSSAPLFAGDLSDPWVAELAASLPVGTRRIDCPGALPESWPDPHRPAPVLVLHRAVLETADGDRLRLARRAGLFERLILCLGPHARYHQVQRWAPLAAVILPEATAAAILPRYLAETPPAPVPPPPHHAMVAVSSHRALRDVLEAMGRSQGFEVATATDWSNAPDLPLAVWDVPVLDPHWPEQLAEQAARRRVVAMLGFPDRATVTLARRSGAAACLEWPCDPADLAYVLHEIARGNTAGVVAGPTRRS